MNNVNQIIIGGRLTADPELRQTPGGLFVTRFSIANKRLRPKDGGEAQTDFFDVTAFDSRAEFVCNHFHKGSSILIVGRLQQRRWENKTGEKRQSIEISASEIHFADPYDPADEEKKAAQPVADKQYAPVTVPRTGKQVGVPIPPSYVEKYGNSKPDFEELPDGDQLPF